MSWIPITAADLNATKLAPLVSALRGAALADGQTDPVVEITQEVIDRVRRMIAACRKNLVDPDPTLIPPSLKSLACRMIIRAAKDRLEIGLTEVETKQWDVDERELTRISNCEIPIETADTMVTPSVQITQPGPSIRPPTGSTFNRQSQEGV